MYDEHIELFLIVLIIALAIFIIADRWVSQAIIPVAVLGSGLLTKSADPTIESQITKVESSVKPDNVKPTAELDREDNIHYVPINPFTTLGGKEQYDEYDDDEYIERIDEQTSKVKNIVIDGNNFVYRYYADSTGKNRMPGLDEYYEYISKSVKLLADNLKDKNIFIILKDPETEEQSKFLMKKYNATTVPTAHKIAFYDLTKKYPNVRFIVAYGDEKYRDDYAAIWLTDVLGDNTILLSRDRYSDIREMQGKKITFQVYGKNARQYKKQLNKPFTHINRGILTSSLVGYSFSKKRKTGFYTRYMKGRKSLASDLVYCITL